MRELLITLAALGPSQEPPSLATGAAPSPPPFAVWVDQRRHDVVLRLGPFPLPANEPEAGAGEHEGHAGMDHSHGSRLPAYRFRWPVAGWGRGFRVEITDESGQPLSQRLLHHVNLNHLGRRALAFPTFDRVMAAGQETRGLRLPRTVGIWIEKGAEMAMTSMWTNETGKDLPGVVMVLTIPYLRETLVPRPVSARPIVLDIGFRPGLTAGFDLDTGRKEFRREFVFQVDGRLLALGGHLHDYGHSIELRDGETGEVLVALKGKLAPDGGLLGVTRKLLATRGEGLRLRAGHPYVVVARYHNISGRPISMGGMAALGGLFVPDRADDWPPLDRNDPVYRAEMEGLGVAGWVEVPESALGSAPGVKR